MGEQALSARTEQPPNLTDDPAQRPVSLRPTAPTSAIRAPDTKPTGRPAAAVARCRCQSRCPQRRRGTQPNAPLAAKVKHDAATSRDVANERGCRAAEAAAPAAAPGQHQRRGRQRRSSRRSQQPHVEEKEPAQVGRPTVAAAAAALADVAAADAAAAT